MLFLDVDGLARVVSIGKTELIGDEELSSSVCELIYDVLELVEVFLRGERWHSDGNYGMSEGLNHEELLYG